jgi:hypothetical protein
VKTFSTTNIETDQGTPGTNSPSVSLKMFVEQGEERYPVYSRNLTVESLRNILRLCGLYQEDVTYITRGAPIKLSITVSAWEQKSSPIRDGG